MKFMDRSRYAGAKSSSYRQSIRALAIPLDERTIGAMKIAEQASRGSGIITDTFIDLPRLLEFLGNIEAIASLHGISTPSLDDSLDNVWRQLFYENGAFFDFLGGIVLGPLIAEHKFGGVNIFLPALTQNPGGHLSGYMVARGDSSSEGGPIPERIFIDLAEVLEQVVFRINMFRYYQLEPSSSRLFFNDRELDKLDSKTIQRRLRSFVPDGGYGFKFDNFRRTVLDLKSGSDDYSLTVAFSQALIIRLWGLHIRSEYNEDPVQHTVNLVNSLVRSLIITELAVHATVQRSGPDYDSPESIKFQNLVAWLADIVYGSPLHRLGVLSYVGLTDPSEHVSYFNQHGMANILSHLNLPDLPSTSFERRFALLSTEASAYAAAAQAVLDEVLMGKLSADSADVLPVSEFEKIRRTTFVTPETLSTIAHVWSQRFP